MEKTELYSSCEQRLSDENNIIMKRALIDEKLLMQHLKKYTDKRYSNALDVACGSGVTSHILKRALDVKEIYGIDIDPDVINYAKHRAEENMFFQIGDALSIPYKQNSFDFTFARMLFEVCPCPEKVVDETIRVTKPGGRVLFWGNMESTPSIYPTPLHYNKYVEAEMRLIRATRKFSYNPLELYSIFEKKGLKKVELNPIVKDTNKCTKEELIDYYYENHDYENSLLVKMGFFTSKELQEYDQSLLEVMKCKQSYYFFLQYYITAIVDK